MKLTSARLPSVAFRSEGAWLWSSATEVILQVSVLICRFCKDEIWWSYFFNGKCIHGSNKHNNHWLHTKCIQDFRIVHRCPRTLIYIVLQQWDFNTGGPVHMLKAPMGDWQICTGSFGYKKGRLWPYKYGSMILPTESRAPKTRLLRHTSISQSCAKFGARSFNQSWNGKRCRRLAQLGIFLSQLVKPSAIKWNALHYSRIYDVFHRLYIAHSSCTLCRLKYDQFHRSRHSITFNTPNSSAWKYHALSYKHPANSSEARSETPSWCTILFATSGLVTDGIVQDSLLSEFHFLCYVRLVEVKVYGW